MVPLRVHSTIRCQSHEMDLFASLFRIRESRNDLRIFHDRTILASTVNLDEVLINYTTCTDIEVTNLRVTHLSVWKTYILTASLQLRVCAGCEKKVQIRSRCIINNITFTLLSDAPSVEDHQ